MDLDWLLSEAQALVIPVGVAVVFAATMRALLKKTLARVEAQAASHAQTTPTAAADQAAEEPTARRESDTGSGDSPASPNRLTP